MNEARNSKVGFAQFAMRQSDPRFSEPTAGLIGKLNRIAVLSDGDQSALVCALDAFRSWHAGSQLYIEAGSAMLVQFLLSGIACRFKLGADGRRQMTGLLLPGDVCAASLTNASPQDQAISFLTPASTAQLSGAAADALFATYPALRRAVWGSTLIDEAITREWVVNIGHRGALSRLGHFFLETYERLQLVGLASNDRCELRMTQCNLGEALALTTVHVNRTLKHLRERQIATYQGGLLCIVDRPALVALSGFDRQYLHTDLVGNHRATPATKSHLLRTRSALKHAVRDDRPGSAYLRMNHPVLPKS